MADIKISQLTAKGSAIASTDLLEISESDGAGGYVTKSVTGANIIGSKQDTLVSGTNIKTINSTTLLGSGNLAVQPTLVSSTNIKTINSNTLLGSGDLSVQPTLVSGTNIKTINSNSILGSGDLVITGGVSSVSATTPVVATGTTTPVISLASNYGDTQNPYASKTANNILAAPNGSSGVPTFRAIVGADIPTLNQNTTGTANNVTGIVAVANGGTGTATPSLVAGTNVTITGTFPNQTINSTGGGGGGNTVTTHILSKPQSLFYYSNALTNSALISGFKTANIMNLTNFTPAYNLTINTFLIEVTTIDAVGLGKVVIYSNLNGLPDTKLLESVSVSSATLGVKTITGFTFTFTAGVTYWIGVPSNSSTNRFKAMNYNSSMVAPLISTSDTFFSNFWNIYSDYATMPTTITGLNTSNLGINEHITHLVFRAA